ncbi:MAG: hypothetical protein IPG77_24360 [Betaproteobacteria bacterium]|nr:hypothetical protein [Betaproteobacteria bacterium]
MLTTQVLAVPLHAPDHPPKVEPLAGATVSVTEVFSAKLALHVVPQLMPDGLLTTVPLPVPALVTVSVGGPPTNVAVTVLAVLMLTTQVLVVPVQAPDQPPKAEPLAGAAVSVTELFSAKAELQVAPQLMPDGLLTTVPLPVPALVTVSVGGPPTNVAVTVLAVLMLTTQVLVVPVQAPDQPPKVEPLADAASSVTELFSAKAELQVAPQLMPDGLLTTVPLPVPALVTVSVGGPPTNVAVTVLAVLMLTTQVLVVPVQAPTNPRRSSRWRTLPAASPSCSAQKLSCRWRRS